MLDLYSVLTYFRALNVTLFCTVRAVPYIRLLHPVRVRTEYNNIIAPYVPCTRTVRNVSLLLRTMRMRTERNVYFTVASRALARSVNPCVEVGGQ